MTLLNDKKRRCRLISTARGIVRRLLRKRTKNTRKRTNILLNARKTTISFLAIVRARKRQCRIISTAWAPLRRVTANSSRIGKVSRNPIHLARRFWYARRPRLPFSVTDQRAAYGLLQFTVRLCSLYYTTKKAPTGNNSSQDTVCRALSPIKISELHFAEVGVTILHLGIDVLL